MNNLTDDGRNNNSPNTDRGQNNNQNTSYNYRNYNTRRNNFRGRNTNRNQDSRNNDFNARRCYTCNRVGNFSSQRRVDSNTNSNNNNIIRLPDQNNFTQLPTGNYNIIHTTSERNVIKRDILLYIVVCYKKQHDKRASNIDKILYFIIYE
jgi:hypothetical protein